MFKILKKENLNAQMALLVIEAPLIAQKAKAGQFIIFRINEQGERVPLTIADCDPIEGTVTIIVQAIGKTTHMLYNMKEGQSLTDFVGPLGKPTELEGISSACIIGGGVGTAIAYPQTKALYQNGAHVDVIAGFKNNELVILEEAMRKVAHNYYLATDDGSAGRKGFVTGVLAELLAQGNAYDAVIAIGPLPMMKRVCEVTKPYGIKTIVSLNPIMIDGTGMCGGCRVKVGGETRFACVDGPDFDGHKVDFNELIARNAFYRAQEQTSLDHYCRLEGMNNA